MKIGRPRAIWPLGPIPTAGRYELVCWLAAAVLALALAFVPAPTLERSAQPIAAIAPTPVPHLAVYQRLCIERILVRAADKSEEAVVAEINRVCLAPQRTTRFSAAGSVIASCGRRFDAPFTPAFRPVSGCLGG